MPDTAVEDAPLPDSLTVQEEDLTHTFPGKSTDPSILWSFNSHVDVAVWQEELARCTYRFVNKLLISSFVERWQPEMNTFHMTVGEMTLTLDNVGTIFSLPIVSRSVSVPDVTNLHGATLLVFGLGITERVAHDELSTVGGNLVRLEWLRSQFASVTDSDPEEAIQCIARAYLLFLVGCTLFSDKSGGRVPVVHLGLLMDLGSVHIYAWGTATLAFLYKQLGYASWSGVKQMGGYMTYLEAWIY
ncbi:protein MAIN-LIKE 1-like [Camellia sinensis]|uniref:protein MAIN-LIKE 1-like n=1 Tax=Camellia sinensis TaxID=4442 RepID=UPI001035E267|nr:protein MAIN-LIKE 1-like [Camellia sinensis]